MSKLIDLSGKKFNRLLVLEKYEYKVFPNGRRQMQYKCLCDCGNEIIVLGGSLKSGNTKSCGCLQVEAAIRMGKNNTVDLTGKKFGRLLVLYIDEEHVGKHLKWICLCECGNMTSVFGENLQSGNTLSCGCLQKESMAQVGRNNSHSLINKRFGKLVVLGLHSTDRNGVNWNCQCDCGKTTIVPTSRLSRGTLSCGCLSESFIASELKKYILEKYLSETEYRILKNQDTNQYLPYDIYIPCGDNSDINGFYIEVHGLQHYELSGWHDKQAKNNGSTPEEEFKYQKYKDKLKKSFAKKNGVYIEVDLRKIKTIEEAIEYVENLLQ